MNKRKKQKRKVVGVFMDCFANPSPTAYHEIVQSHVSPCAICTQLQDSLGLIGPVTTARGRRSMIFSFIQSECISDLVELTEVRICSYIPNTIKYY